MARYYVVWWGVVAQILSMKRKEGHTRSKLLLCLLLRILPAVIMEHTDKSRTALALSF